MRTMFAVGHQNRTHTTIVIRARLPEGRRKDAAKRDRPVAPPPLRDETPVPVPAPGAVH